MSRIVGLYQVMMRHTSNTSFLTPFSNRSAIAVSSKSMPPTPNPVPSGRRSRRPRCHYRAYRTRYLFQPGSPSPFLPSERRLIESVLDVLDRRFLLIYDSDSRSTKPSNSRSKTKSSPIFSAPLHPTEYPPPSNPCAAASHSRKPPCHNGRTPARDRNGPRLRRSRQSPVVNLDIPYASPRSKASIASATAFERSMSSMCGQPRMGGRRHPLGKVVQGPTPRCTLPASLQSARESHP